MGIWRRLAVAALAAVFCCPMMTTEAQRPDDGAGVAFLSPCRCGDGTTAGRCSGTDSVVDSDVDGLTNRCEHALARAFAPELVVDAGECGWSAAAQPARPGGAYLYVVGRGAAGTLRLAYLPAYYEDCGWSGPKCLLTGPMCRGHAGDSELILVDVAYDPARREWATQGVFLSAHCNGSVANRCRWYRGADLDAFAWANDRPRSAPVVWVARGTHANYPTRRGCDRGFWGYDTCDRNRVRLRFPVLDPAQNAGSRTRPFGGRSDAKGCVEQPAVSGETALRDDARMECVWSVDGAFTGWRPPSGDQPTPYGCHLRNYAGF